MERRKPSVLLHVCCGPCSTAVIERLRGKFDLTLFFANANLHPREEYERRLEAARHVAARYEIPLVVADDDHGAWLEAVQGLEWEKEGGARCDICFQVRLEETAREAESRGMDWFTTTLSISPHKNAKRISEIGRRATMNRKVRFLDENFRKREGFRRSVKLSREMGLYRQDYCGCEFSMNRLS
ncbi:MAG: epoxyqueuosine reductase QueH [Candidatus Eisenbacteria sp.]|nr:epoxyqueuosine reductase QueH [Candidatus Eisenbacteria bacterium]